MEVVIVVFRPELSWEFLSADEIEAKSIRAIRNHVRHVKEVSAYYREALFDVFPEDIKSRADVSRLPRTERSALAQHLPSFLAVSEDQVVETVLTGGATAGPLAFPLTATDLSRLEFNEALSFYSAGVGPSDRAHICTPCDRLLMAGIAYYRGLTHLGVNTARIGVLSSDVHKRYFDALKPTLLVGAPSFFQRLKSELEKLHFNANASTIKKIFCIGESIRTSSLQANAVGKSLEDFFKAEVFSSYSNTELSVSFCECSARRGGHAHPELVYAEIVDEKGAEVPDGVPGELVATPLGVDGVPLVRYKTGDITFKVAGTCACGRNSARIGPILGRTSQVIKVKGEPLYPLSVTSLLDDIKEIEDYCLVLENDESNSDRISLHAVTPPANMATISARIRAELHINLPVLISNFATIRHLRQSSEKMRIVDKRKHAATTSARSEPRL